MCGIVGYVGRRDASPILVEGLQRLEYRGYDSAGVAVVNDGSIRVHKAKGRVSDLLAGLPKRFGGTIGIGHTRWATHGVPNEPNAHPHLDAEGRIAIVHNGIIENFKEIRGKLQSEGVAFSSDTDSEVLAHLISRSKAEGLVEKVREALLSVEGTYGICVVDRDTPDTLVAARNGSPIVIGIGEKENFIASDVAALVRHTQQVVYLDDGEIAIVKANEFQTLGLDLSERTKRSQKVDWDVGTYDKGAHDHYLRKEILEQPEAVTRALSGRLDTRFSTSHLGGVELDPKEILRIKRIQVLACGSGYYAGLAGARLIESLSRIPSSAEPASEFRYRNPIVDPDTLYIAVSQSGETLDTLRAVQEVKRKGGMVTGIVNVVGSSIARECGSGIYLHAGPEVSVASTKAFTSTIVAFALLGLHLGRVRDLSPSDGARIINALSSLPDKITETLQTEEQVADLAKKYLDSTSAFFIGRVNGFPIACEGAQKLKEISYVHAEAYPASELKHGPLALVCPEFVSVVLFPNDDLYDKNVSAMEEIKARNGPVISVGHNPELAAISDDFVRVPSSEPELDSILINIPLQLFAYHSALIRGVDIDQPRNLAKSVTVE